MVTAMRAEPTINCFRMGVVYRDRYAPKEQDSARNIGEIRCALDELDQGESDIRRAIRDLPDEYREARPRFEWLCGACHASVDLDDPRSTRSSKGADVHQLAHRVDAVTQ